MHARPVRPSGRRPPEPAILAAWVLVAFGGSLVTIWTLVSYLRTPVSVAAVAPTSTIEEPLVHSPATSVPEISVPLGERPPTPVPNLTTCTQPESVVVLEDNSISVSELDPADLRIEAVRAMLTLLEAAPCTADDLTTVISFTNSVETTGPQRAGDFGPITRATGGGTDIRGAVEAALDVYAANPGHRPVLILLSDLEERSDVPLSTTLEQLDELGVELIVVSIGERGARSAVADLELRRSASIAGDLVAAINRSRQEA